MKQRQPTTAAENEHGGSIGGKLGRLLTYHEEHVRAIRLVLAELNGSATAAKQNGHRSVIAEALALDTQRVQQKKAKKQPRTGQHKAGLRARRELSAKFLDAFSDGKRITLAEAASATGLSPRMAPVLILHGYLKGDKAHGYKRTAKPFVP